MKKQFLILGMVTGLTLGMAFTCFAGEWKQDSEGYWYQEDDGTYPVNTWKEIGSKQYYFGADGYMLSNTTTPDGYQVGPDGAWIQEKNSLTKSQSNYSATPRSVGFVGNNIVYRSYPNVVAANLDGSNPRVIATDVFLNVIVGPDDKVYFGTNQGSLQRCNIDGSGLETLFTLPPTVYTDSVTGEVLASMPKTIQIDFADATGIQIRGGYYDIQTDTYHEGEERAVKTSGYAGMNPAPSKFLEAIPDRTGAYTKVTEQTANYIIIGTYDANGRSAFNDPYDMKGMYIINMNTNRCIYRLEANVIASDDEIYELSESDCGLIAVTANGVYRIENGNMVKLTGNEKYTREVVAKYGFLYFLDENMELKVLNIGTFSMP